MENHHPQQSSESSPPHETQSNSRWKLASSNLLKLINYSPWFIWIGVVGFLYIVISISFSSITNVSYVKDKPIPAAKAKPTSSSPTSSAVPLWLLGTVALCCVTSAVAIAKRRQISSQLSHLQQHFQFNSTRVIARRQQRKLMLQSRQQMLSTPAEEEAAETEVVPVQPALENQPLESPANLPAEEKICQDQPLSLGESPGQVLGEKIFLSQDQTFSSMQELEAGETSTATGTESLVDMLDIRKKLPLSVILGKN